MRRSEGAVAMEHFWEILTKSDNLPIVGMLLAVIFCLWVALRQAVKHDKLIAQGKKDDIYGEMIK
jgi:EamA domain-containing membrane protein RarD